MVAAPDRARSASRMFTTINNRQQLERTLTMRSTPKIVSIVAGALLACGASFAAMASPASGYTLQRGTLLSTHTPATSSCPVTWWKLQAGPGNTLQGTIGVAGTNRILDVSGTYDSTGLFRLSSQEAGSAEKTGTVDAQVQSNGSLVLTITNNGDPSPCLNRTVYLPWFRNGNDFDPNGGAAGGF
jgi:hypothetical protein